MLVITTINAHEALQHRAELAVHFAPDPSLGSTIFWLTCFADAFTGPTNAATSAAVAGKGAIGA
eukprot:3287118-Pyramimonas_sp.AAC.1